MVSVILPNYNHAPYLQKRIESILNQSYKNFELIILDDCSTDNSIQIIEQYTSNPKITNVIYNTVNSGSPFIQWQKGFALSKGEYIWIAESDDYAHPRLLELLLESLDESENVGVAYSDSNVVDSKEILHPNFYKKHRNSCFRTNKWDHNYIKNGFEEIKENLFYECTINNTSAMVFRKSLLRHIDFNKLKTFKYCGDWFFFISLLHHCDIAYKKDALNFFKYGTDNFKPGTKSVLNYFKERFIVRYHFWKNIYPIFTKGEREKLYKQLGTEMSIQINEVVKGKSSFLNTIKSFALLCSINRNLFMNHVVYAFRSYIWKN